MTPAPGRHGPCPVLRFGVFDPRDVTALCTARKTYSGEDFSLAHGETRNRSMLAEYLGCKPGGVVFLDQVHSNAVVRVDGPLSSPPEADAAVNDGSGIFIGGLSADCPIVLLHDPENGAVGMAHSGRRGTAGGIVTNTIRKMKDEYGSAAGNLRAAVGPGIGKCCYEVGPEVVMEMSSSLADVDDFTWRKDDGKFLLDLAGLVERELLEAGVKRSNIERANLCTVCNVGEYFSYRAEGEAAGRFAAVIGKNRRRI